MEITDADRSRIFGIDDQIVHGLAGLFEDHAEIAADVTKSITGKARGFLSISNSIEQIRENSYLKSAFAKYAEEEKSFGYPHRRGALEHFGDYLSSTPDIRPDDVSKALRFQGALYSTPYMIEGFIQWIIRDVRAKEEKTKDQLIPSNIQQVADTYFKAGDLKPVIDMVHLSWRNLLMVRNFLESYCKSLELDKPPKDFYIFAGDLHVPGLEAMLKSVLGSEPQITAHRYNTEDAVKDLRAVAQELKAQLKKHSFDPRLHASGFSFPKLAPP